MIDTKGYKNKVIVCSLILKYSVVASDMDM